MFYHTNDVVESKMVREMLCFTVETAVLGRESRICQTAGAGYARAGLAIVRTVMATWRKPICGILLGNATADC